jgi:hypothetical protein
MGLIVIWDGGIVDCIVNGLARCWDRTDSAVTAIAPAVESGENRTIFFINLWTDDNT